MAVPSVRFTNLTLLSPEGLQVRSGRPQTSVYAVVHSVRWRRSAAQRSAANGRRLCRRRTMRASTSSRPHSCTAAVRMRIGADATLCRGRTAAASAAVSERLGWARTRRYARNELELQAVSEIAKVVEGRLIDIDRAAKEVSPPSCAASRVQAAALCLGAIAPLRRTLGPVPHSSQRSTTVGPIARRRRADKSTKSLSVCGNFLWPTH
jgi:hypothetical protein